MRRVVIAVATFIVGAMVCNGSSAGAQSGKRPDGAPSRAAIKAKKNVKAKPSAPPFVAYDARDHRYYALKWAKAHKMRDPAGDALIPLPLDKLPKGANPAIAPSRP